MLHMYSPTKGGEALLGADNEEQSLGCQSSDTIRLNRNGSMHEASIHINR